MNQLESSLAVQREYRKSILDPNSKLTKYVEVYIRFLSFGEIDTMNEKYQAEILIESKWSLDGDLSSYDPKIDWNPKLYVENALNDVKESISYQSFKVADELIIIESRYIKGISLI